MINLNAFAGYLGATGNALVNLDDNNQGWEDVTGALLLYAGDVINTVGNGEDLPEFPEVLKTLTTQKITGAFRATLIVISSVLGFAQFQVSGKAAVALKYVSQVLTQMLRNNPQPVPIPPVLMGK